MKKIIEICAASFESVMAADRAGANRVELCSVLNVGGVTPSYGFISQSRRNTSMDINVLIRPRPGDFIYSDFEVEEVIRDIEFVSKENVNGVVVGSLTNRGEVDKYISKEWISYAKRRGLSVTFHRAIDCAVDIYQAMEDVIGLGADRILTSGGHPTAIEGIEVLTKMNKQAGGRIIIMPASGINYTNILQISAETGVSEIHFSASKSQPSQILEYGGIGGPEIITHSDEELIRKAIKTLN